ncbi:MAG: PD40 domain-containing protein [Bacteriovoracaceae bacterium]|nr:PD40 domain-containing protein [Bacteriovoracaceae bacterium]
MKRLLAFVLVLTFSLSLVAEDVVIVPVGDAELQTSNIFVKAPKLNNSFGPAQKKQIRQIVKLINNDFSFYKKIFKVMKDGNGKLDYLIDCVAKPIPGGVEFQTHYNDMAKNKKVINKFNITFAKTREYGHRLSDAIYQLIMGKESIFTSKMVFVSDRTSVGRKIRKELYMMDFDGLGIVRLTHHNGTVISPAISSDGKKVLYSLIREGVRRRNINLYMMDLTTKKFHLLSSRKGINSGAVFLPGDKEIFLTMSHSGNSEIYKMVLKTKKLTAVTKHYAIDVDPSINNNGSLMTFLSGRAGKPMIYTLDPRGREKNVKRVSYVGRFNATPRFSPDGREIVFSSWLDNRFDIFRIDSKGLNLSRLTKNFGSNEDPTYSKDGQFIAFSSKRVLSKYKAVQNIYIMDRDGDILGNITKKFGNCITPRWSK